MNKITSNSDNPFTLAWWMDIELYAKEKADDFFEKQNVCFKTGKKEDMKYYYHQAQRYNSLWIYIRKRIKREFALKG